MIQSKQIVVMAGGDTEERDVSLSSGRAITRALRGMGHTVVELDPSSAGWEIPSSIDVVFLALHGRYGEDGTLQAELEERGIVYTGCGPAASRLAFDKWKAKERFEAEGLSTPGYRIVKSEDAPIPDGLRSPLVLKPIAQGSSVGLRFVWEDEAWSEALREAFAYGGNVLVEEYIRGRELTVGLMGERVLPPVEIRPRGGTYDYHHKYTVGATEYLCPAAFEEEERRVCEEAALRAFRALGCEGYGRVDMILREGVPWILEINTLPGMTETSLLPMAAKAVGESFGSLCDWMVQDALMRHGNGKKPLTLR